METQQTQINNIAETVDSHDSEIIFLNEDVSSQGERLDIVEEDVDEWDDKITALEVANVDITDRLITVEDILLGKLDIYPQIRVFHDLSATQEWQYCKLRFGHAIQN